MQRHGSSGALRIAGIRLNVGELERSIRFYEQGLGFAVEARDEARAEMMLGGERLTLVQASADATFYPPEPAANDLWFQHFAIRVSDMEAAFAQLSRQDQEPISTGGPQQLPPSTGSVIAYKFRDPDRHPLELSFVPGGVGRGKGASPFLTIDHTAIAVADLERSVAFWTQVLGFRETARLLNEGPTQWRLDGLDGALVDIVVLEPPAGTGPHLELLHYRAPRSDRTPERVRRGNIVATRTRCALGAEELERARHRLEQFGCVGDGDHAGALIIADPDGHWVELVTVPAELGISAE